MYIGAKRRYINTLLSFPFPFLKNPTALCGRSRRSSSHELEALNDSASNLYRSTTSVRHRLVRAPSQRRPAFARRDLMTSGWSHGARLRPRPPTTPRSTLRDDRASRRAFSKPLTCLDGQRSYRQPDRPVNGTANPSRVKFKAEYRDLSWKL